MRDVEAVARLRGLLQVGARNMQNFALLKESAAQACRSAQARNVRPRSRSCCAAEYVLAEGNADVDPLRARHPHVRAADPLTLDLAAVPVLKALTHLPVIVDPSHAAGRRDSSSRSRWPRPRPGRTGSSSSATRTRRRALRRPAVAALQQLRTLRGARRSRSPVVGAPPRRRSDAMVPVTAAELASGVRDRRIERGLAAHDAREGAHRAHCRSSTAMAEVVVRGRAETHAILRRDDRLLISSAGAPCTTRRSRSTTPPAAPTRRALRGPLRRDAGVLREAAHDHRAGRAYQRPAPGRFARRRLRLHPARELLLGVLTLACPSAASSSTPSRRSTSPTPSPGARSALAHEPGAPPVRLGPVDARRVQEPTDGDVQIAVDACIPRRRTHLLGRRLRAAAPPSFTPPATRTAT